MKWKKWIIYTNEKKWKKLYVEKKLNKLYITNEWNIFVFSSCLETSLGKWNEIENTKGRTATKSINRTKTTNHQQF